MECVYIVQSSYGQYDDSYEVIVGVRSKQEDAETLRDNVISKINESCKEPEPQEEDYKTYEEYSKAWGAWDAKLDNAMDFNHCYVIKTPLDVAFDYKDIKPKCI